MKNKIKLMPILLSAVLILQCILYNMLLPVSMVLQEKVTSLEELRTYSTEVFIKDTVRAEQRKILNAIRQSWIQYVTLNQDIELLLRKDGYYVYANENNEEVLYDHSKMKVEKKDSYYSVYNKITGELLIEKARPQWNKNAIQEVLSVVAIPVKAFDTNSELIAFDIYTGEIFLNTSGRDNQDIIQMLMEKSDTQRNSELTSLHFEQSDMLVSNANNFNDYQLGKHDRLFIEKVILPYESVGVEGLDMQIGISIAVRESELMKPYQDIIHDNDKLLHELSDLVIGLKVIPKLIVVSSIAVIFISIIVARKNEIAMIKKKRE